MQYMGSKNKLSKDLIPIIQSFITDETKAYVEPFVGGANVIDKVQCDVKIGYDIKSELIELLKYCQVIENQLPQHISEDEYVRVRDNKTEYDKWYVGLVGFCATYSARWFNGYARGNKANGQPRDMSNEAIRNLERQRINLVGIEFKVKNYLDITPKEFQGCVIYCDPPYRNTKAYSTDKFNHSEFYEWCVEMSKVNTVLISEYNIEDERFEVIWQKESKVGIDSKKVNHTSRVEKLYICKGEI